MLWKILKILMIVGALIITIPIILINIFGISMSMWVNDMNAYNDAVRNGKEPEEVALAMPMRLLSWYDKNKEFRAMFDTDDLNNARNVSYSVTINMADLLKPGEALPEKIYYPLFAKARAPRYLEPLCQDVLEALGTKCVVGYSHTSISNDNKVKLTGKLYYLPKYDLGEAEQQNGAKFNTSFVSLSNKVSYDSDLTPDNAQNRAAKYRLAINICAGLKAQYGNCIISNISLQHKEWGKHQLDRFPAGVYPEHLVASASFEVYMPVNKIILANYKYNTSELARTHLSASN